MAEAPLDLDAIRAKIREAENGWICINHDEYCRDVPALLAAYERVVAELGALEEQFRREAVESSPKMIHKGVVADRLLRCMQSRP